MGSAIGSLEQSNSAEDLTYNRHADGGHIPLVSVAARGDRSIPSLISATGYGAIITQVDEAGEERAIELCAREEDGSVPQWVLNRWLLRIGVSAIATADGTWLHPSGDRVPYAADTSSLAAAGSSSVQYSHTYYQHLASEMGAGFGPLGYGGTVAAYTMAQLGVISPRITSTTGQIPASGAVEVTTPDLWHPNVPGIPGTLAGVVGVLSQAGAGKPLLFRRSADGNAVPLPDGSPFTSRHLRYRDSVFILEIGKNDVSAGRAAPDILRDILKIDSWFSPYKSQAIIMGLFPDGGYSDARRRTVNDINAGLKAAFGIRFVDQLEWLLSDRLWIDIGVTPTQQDLDEQANGYVPRSLMDKARAHLTAEMYEQRAIHLVRPKLAVMGHIPETLTWP
ncbi:hypothetical protein ACUSIJ_01495 [Pseudochelatococcus sp. B33]